MPPFRPQDLTGKVRKIDKYYFANGGLADIWRAELSRGSSRRIVYSSLYSNLLVHSHLQCQVAVKVIRSAWSKGDHLETLKTVRLHVQLTIPTLYSLVSRNFYGRRRFGASLIIPTLHPSTASVSIWERHQHRVWFVLTLRTEMLQTF